MKRRFTRRVYRAVFLFPLPFTNILPKPWYLGSFFFLQITCRVIARVIIFRLSLKEMVKKIVAVNGCQQLSFLWALEQFPQKCKTAPK